MLSFKEKNKKFNFRVGAIIVSRDKSKVLLHTISGYGFYLLPGGRVEWDESCIDAIKRELKEEILLENVVPRERLILENFFEFNNVKYQEISINFVVELDESQSELEKMEQFHGIEGEKYLYRWVKIKEIDNFILKPATLKDVIKNYNGNFEYALVDERE